MSAVTTLPWGPAERDGLLPLEGGISNVAGIRAAGIAAGLKPSGAPDLALVDAGRPVPVAVTTTTNVVRAAPCVVTERHAADGSARAVVINSGQANACTGERGLSDAEATAAALASALGCEPTDVLPLSTGIIGVALPLEALVAAVPDLVAALGDDPADAAAAAGAITTTDTVTKVRAYRVDDATGSAHVAGFAKGAGMIEPAMATLLGVLATDAPLASPVLRQILRRSVARSFNRVSIDACGSTNDTIVLFSTGAAEQPAGLEAVAQGIEAVCADLAYDVVADGEGTGKVAAVTVRGAPSEDEAERLARAITSSVLVRSALHGADPNWGRILAAMGGAGVAFDPDRVHVVCGGITVCRFGTAAVFDRGQAAAALAKDEVTIDVELSSGRHEATMLTADLTPQYVADNAYYTT